MNLLDRNFPDELAERCKSFTGRACMTDAVKDSLFKGFEAVESLKIERLKRMTAERKLEDVLQALQLRENAETVLAHTLRKARDPEAFYLDEAK